MCALSMIVDQGKRDLDWFRQQIQPKDTYRIEQLAARVKALEALMAAAKKYDDATGQPDCEMDEKRLALKTLADELGVEIRFPA